MPIYQCKICNKYFKQRSNYICHINNKHTCSPETENIIFEHVDVIFACNMCQNTFTRRSSLERHINNNRCKIKKQEEKQKQQAIEDKITKSLHKELQKLNKKIEELQKSQSNNSVNITNSHNTNINNHITNNITILDFESEEDNVLQDKDTLIQLFNFGFMCVPKYIELVHFCRETPQNHNIRITNLKSNLIQVYRGGKFITRPLNSVINELIGEKEHRLIEAYKELKQKDTNFFVKIFEDYLNKRKAEPEKTLKQIRKNCHIHIFNCSDNNNVGMKLEEDIIEKMSIVHEF